MSDTHKDLKQNDSFSIQYYIRYHAKLTIQCNVVRCYFKAFSVISAVLGKHFVCFQVYTLTNRTEYYIPRNIKGKTSLPLSLRPRYQYSLLMLSAKEHFIFILGITQRLSANTMEAPLCRYSLSWQILVNSNSILQARGQSK